MIKIGSYCLYKGIGVREWKNKMIKVLYCTEEKIGKNNNINVYICEDEDTKEVRKVIETDLLSLVEKENI